MSCETPDSSFQGATGTQPQTPLSIVSRGSENESFAPADESLITSSPKHKFQPPSFKQKPIYSHRNSTSNLVTSRNLQYPPAPAPRFKRRSSTSQQTLTRAQRDKMFDDDNDEDSYIDDSLMYNVPIASHSSLGILQPHRKLLSQTNVVVPPSPLPGCEATFTETPTLRSNPSFVMLSPEAKQLSSFYEMSVQSSARQELERRRTANSLVGVPTVTSSSDSNTSALSQLEDLSLASIEKNKSMTITRPTWLPPKDPLEMSLHEKQYQRILRMHNKANIREAKL